MKHPTIEDYGMAIGGLWFQEMVDKGWILGETVQVNVQQCRDVVSVVEETELVVFGDDEDEDEMRVALQMLIGSLDVELDDDFDRAFEMAMEFIAEKYS